MSRCEAVVLERYVYTLSKTVSDCCQLLFCSVKNPLLRTPAWCLSCLVEYSEEKRFSVPNFSPRAECLHHILKVFSSQGKISLKQTCTFLTLHKSVESIKNPHQCGVAGSHLSGSGRVRGGGGQHEEHQL